MVARKDVERCQNLKVLEIEPSVSWTGVSGTASGAQKCRGHGTRVTSVSLPHDNSRSHFMEGAPQEP